MKKKIVSLLVLTLFLKLQEQPASAVILYGSGDPAYNTTPPTGALANSGWQYEGYWGGFLGTPIASQYFITARHVGGSIGDQLWFNGVGYATTACWDDTNSDLRIWKIDGAAFPYWAPLYATNNELGKTMVVIGRGTERGDPVYATLIQTVYTTNSVDIRSIGLSKKDAKSMFPDATWHGNVITLVTSELETNTYLRGWKIGAYDGVMRWGENQVCAAGNFLIAAFTGTNGPNEGYLSFGDSSGACFIQDADGKWKLAGLNYGIDGPFSSSVDGLNPFYGAIFNEDGLYAMGTYIPDGPPQPAYYYVTSIRNRVSWIRSIINQ